MPTVTRLEPGSVLSVPPFDESSYDASPSLRRVAGFILVAALATIPLDQGGTGPGGAWLLVGFVGAAGVCWVAGLAQAHRVPWTAPVALLGFGMFVVAAIPWLWHWVEPTAVAEFSRVHFAKLAARWPHSVVNTDVGTSVALHASLCLVLWMVADLSQDRAWSILFATTLIATAVIVTILALMQNRLHVSGSYWTTGSRPPGFSWGPFFHHTSAGAYLNSVWPVAAGLTMISRYRLPPGGFQLAVTLAGFFALTLLLGAHASHISRFPQIAAIAVMPLLLFKLKSFHAAPGRIAIATMIAGITLLALWFGRTGEIARRWHLLDLSPAKNIQSVPPESQWPSLVREDLLIPNPYDAGLLGDRGEAQRAAFRAIAARPLTGHGPGNWLGAVSQFSADPYVRTFYLYQQFAHDDFLQAWVESGFPGFVSLVCLLAGGVLVIFRRSSMPSLSAQNLLSYTAALGLAAVLLQSLFDFPLQIPAVALNCHVLAGLCWGGATQSISPLSTT